MEDCSCDCGVVFEIGGCGALGIAGDAFVCGGCDVGPSSFGNAAACCWVWFVVWIALVVTGGWCWVWFECECGWWTWSKRGWPTMKGEGGFC